MEEAHLCGKAELEEGGEGRERLFYYAVHECILSLFGGVGGGSEWDDVPVEVFVLLATKLAIFFVNDGSIA